ncbi:hypothetical protein GEMRC1_008739 [Eukaryota sp. GEM-RC1]
MSQLSIIQDLQTENVAAVEIFGAEALGTAVVSEGPLHRLHVFVSLFLSPRTRDGQTALALDRLHQLPGGLTYQSLLDIEEPNLAKLINCVGFYTQKAKNLKAAVHTFANQYNNDIPSDYDELIALKGVGPKIALLVQQIAFGIVTGVSVDTHVHRISNRLGWTTSATPDKTRDQLEKVFDQKHWTDINFSLVRFGQTVCLPKRPRCHECPISSSCPSRIVGEPPKKKKRT